MATKSQDQKLIYRIFSTAVFAVTAGFPGTPAGASGYIPEILTSSFVDEFRLGVDHMDEQEKKGSTYLNFEVLFRRPNVYYNNRFLLFFLNPRFHIGGHLSLSGDTSQAYAGATWDYRLTNNLFAEASFGGGIHDGKLKQRTTATGRYLGCRVLFRESASVGYEFTENLRFMITIDHMSNAGLCSNNDGLSTFGARIGYKF